MREYGSVKTRILAYFIAVKDFSVALAALTKILHDDSVDNLIASGSHFESWSYNLNIFICSLLLIVSDTFFPENKRN